LRPSRFALGFAAVLVGMLASVAKWPWPAQVAALVVLAALMIPAGAASSAGLKARPAAHRQNREFRPFWRGKTGR
jgi:membrane protein implicated in regulation of membrane protease activity